MRDETLRLAAELVRRLHSQGMTVSTAESCTGGMAARYLTAVPGASNVFALGVVAYANRIKEQELGVSPDTLARDGAVSEPTAREMADGIRKKAGAFLGLSSTGIAGPGGGTPDTPVGTVYIATRTESGGSCERLVLSGNREEIREETTRRLFRLALAALRV